MIRANDWRQGGFYREEPSMSSATLSKPASSSSANGRPGHNPSASPTLGVPTQTTPRPDSRALHSPPAGTAPSVVAWVDSIAALTLPDEVVWCDGSAQEWDGLAKRMLAQGTIVQVNPEYRPYSFLARSDPNDVARVEARTFICSATKDEAGPTNNWADQTEMR